MGSYFIFIIHVLRSVTSDSEQAEPSYRTLGFPQDPLHSRTIDLQVSSASCASLLFTLLGSNSQTVYIHAGNLQII